MIQIQNKKKNKLFVLIFTFKKNKNQILKNIIDYYHIYLYLHYIHAHTRIYVGKLKKFKN